VTVLVTGATGFVGSQVVRHLLESDVEVAALVRPGSDRRRLAGIAGKIQILEADLEDSAAVASQLALARPEACIHTAWYAVPGKYLVAPENLDSLRSSLALLEELARAGCKHVVGVGTCFEYEMAYALLKEDSPTKPTTLYAATKLAFNVVAAQRLKQLGIGMAWARLFYIYGPFEDSRRLVPAAIKALTEGREFATTSGDQVRDYLHIADVASALCALSQNRLEGAFNVCSGEPVTMAGLMRTLGELLGRKELIRLGAFPNREWDPQFVCGDNHRLRTKARWSERYKLHDGLADTIEWWKAGEGAPKQSNQ
jgi:nucleoside-diphosphate-sugar epimerase